MNPNGCIFCHIAAGTAPASVVCRNELALAFMDINQPTPGHVLIIPHAHYCDLYDLPTSEGEAVFALTMAVARAVKRALKPDGMNLIQANEAAGQQEVFHFHMHIVARFAGDRDRIRLGWHNEVLERPELDLLAQRIKAEL